MHLAHEFILAVRTVYSLPAFLVRESLGAPVQIL